MNPVIARVRSPLWVSSIMHLSLVALVLIFSFKWTAKVENKKVDFEVIEYPKQAAPTLQIKPPKVESKPPPEIKKSVFGVSRNAITAADGAQAVEVKAGNTVAKEPDNLELKPNDSSSLPIPTDDYLVSSMPKMKSEVRIPYPPEAKKAGIEGPVVMDLLIDGSGQVRQVQVISGPGYGLNEAAQNAIKQFIFIPAKVGEQAVAVKIRYTYRFILENK